MKLGIYARCSTNQTKQDATKQLELARAFAAKGEHTIVGEYVDYGSGGSNDREAFNRLLADAGKGTFDLVVFQSLDRITRQGTLQTLMILEGWKARGIGFYSLNEPYINSLGPFSDIVISIMSTLAKLERQRISEKTKQSLAIVRQRGTKLGRPEKARWVADEVRRLASQGVPKTEIAKRLKVSRSCVYSALACEA